MVLACLFVLFQDALLCSVVLKYNLPIWTEGEHFKLIAREISSFKLFEV